MRTFAKLFTGIFAMALMMAFVSGAQAEDRQLAHMVYFKLKDDSQPAKERLLTACEKYLSGHEGTVYFSAGILVEELDREVNQRDFDIALHVVFANKAAHDKYQAHPRHLKFIEEGRDNWEAVRVFDAYVIVGDKTSKN